MSYFYNAGPNKRVCAFIIDILSISFICDIFFPAYNVILTCFYILFKDSFNGQSFGKRLVGIQVVNDDGQSMDILRGILRNIVMLIPLFPIVEFFVMLKDIRKKRLGDKIAETQVNDLRIHVRDGDFFLWTVLSILAYAVLLTIVNAIRIHFIKIG